jgi:superfamily II DNA or RNA helicase
MKDYQEFIDRKRHCAEMHGFDPLWMPNFLFDFQAALVDWATKKGRAALYCDCGLGKTPMQLVWAQNVVEKTNGRVLILTPLAVSYQTVSEGDKFGIPVMRSPDGKTAGAGIYVTNYERLHYFDSSDFVGVVCDESSILKGIDGATRAAVTKFVRKLSFRLLCTATAAPNDYIELGTSSEALGEMGFADMLSKFFKKATSTSSRKDEYRSGAYRFRGHAERDFWRWVCSWARACRKPSDLGFDDGRFRLPELITDQHVVKASTLRDGWLFEVPAVGLAEQRAERARTIDDRCHQVADLVDHDRPAVVWCHLNKESELLRKLIPDAVEVKGSDTDDHKESAFRGFQSGEIRVLVTKPSIAGFGLNWQHCNHQTFFPSHSFEQWYQAIRRCWRFGQDKPVTVDVVTTEGEQRVLTNMQEKAKAAEKMFERLVSLMANELKIETKNEMTKQTEVPEWL